MVSLSTSIHSIPNTILSYYPVLTSPQCSGVTTVFNFAPNNWEARFRGSRFLNASYSVDDSWYSTCLGEVEDGASVSITEAHLRASIIGLDTSSTCYLSFGAEPAQQVSDALPKSSIPVTSVPAWRASLGLVAPTGSSISYQGEIDPFPAPGSLLTFGHFLQPSPLVTNSLMFVNLEKSARQRRGFMELRDANNPSGLLAEVEVTNNRVNFISLDNLGFTDECLPLLVCRQMSGIPLYFSHTHDFSALSLEHTHPPASIVIHGDRFKAQRIMKTCWFSKIGR